MWKRTAISLVIAGAATGGTVVADQAINPYEDKGTHYELPITSDIPQGEHVEIAKDRAAMTLKGWNDEYAITIEPQIPSAQLGAADRPFTTQAKRPTLSKKMEYKSGDVTAFIEPKSDKEFDIDFTLDAKPDTNVFTYKIAGAEDFDFFYQPELTPEEIAEGTVRPDNVVGSYAVYSKTKANHKVGDTNYATGKVAHIYRPKATDASGAETWAKLDYSSGILSVTVPQDFLDSATYPVRVDPTFGYTTIGASDSTSAAPNSPVFAAALYTASTGDTITLLSVGGGCTSAQSPAFRSAVYTISSGDPSARITPQTDVATSDTTEQFWNSSALSTSLTNGTTYSAALTVANIACHISVDSTSPGDSDRGTGSSGTMPDPWGHTADISAKYSVYATYTASGGGSSPNVPYKDENWQLLFP